MNKGREEEPPRKKTTETVRYYHEENKDIHEERRLRIEELDEWQEYKPRVYDKPKLCKNKPDTSPNQLQVGDTVLLDAVDPHIVTTTPNEEIPLTVLSIFPFGTVEVSHPKFGTFKAWEKRTKLDTVVRHGRGNQHARCTPACVKFQTRQNRKNAKHTGRNWGTRACPMAAFNVIVKRKENRRISLEEEEGRSSSAGPTAKIHHPYLQFPRGPQEELFQILRVQPLAVDRCIDWAAIEQV
ncbi:hypothetical protein GOBAR_AA13876 [Gossypium barbadense]|uniref:Uncharacterized protein n=1 Tax=Gossypium barbadense TaxID=3634 RepID=A0A2P5XTU2_GOSBA|nr:hypothetical protein GOBAR_AA13876 [Gossypium barbadense]